MLPDKEEKKGQPKTSSKKYWNILGPGLVTGAADDDPSGIQTYSQTGAAFGFNFLWLSLFSFPLMGTIQEMCGRIGMVTGRGLAANIKKHFSKKILYISTLLLFFANTFNLGVDLGAMVKVIQLLFPSLHFGITLILLTVLCLIFEIFIPYKKYVKYLKWLALMLCTYIISALLVGIDWERALYHTIFPTFEFNKEHILIICAVLGTTISPYLFFWQTSEEVEEEIADGKTTIAMRKGATKEEVKNMRIDNWFGMFLSNLVMFFIIIASAVTLNHQGITSIDTLAQAALALKPLAGDFAYILFAIGVISTGLLTVPILAGSASYAISESMGWKEGLYKKLGQAYAFYGVIIVSMGLGALVNFIGIDPVKALIYSAIANGIISPPILALIVLITSNTKIMGEYVNSKIQKIIGWVTVCIMIIVASGAVWSLI